jgi:Fic family protein
MWRSFNINSGSELTLRLENFRILFAFHSGKLENDDVTLSDTREIFENGRAVSFTGDPRALFEQRNQKLAYAWMIDCFDKKRPITLDFILELHDILTAGTYDERQFIERGERPGTFKRHDYVTGRYEVGSAPDETETELSMLLDEVLCASADKALTVAAYFHCRFEQIHPFADGNGRVGRTLLNYLFMYKLNHPPLIIYEDARKDYYAALEDFDSSENLTPMEHFLEAQTIRTWERTLERCRK